MFHAYRVLLATVALATTSTDALRSSRPKRRAPQGYWERAKATGSSVVNAAAKDKLRTGLYSAGGALALDATQALVRGSGVPYLSNGKGVLENSFVAGGWDATLGRMSGWKINGEGVNEEQQLLSEVCAIKPWTRNAPSPPGNSSINAVQSCEEKAEFGADGYIADVNVLPLVKNWKDHNNKLAEYNDRVSQSSNKTELNMAYALFGLGEGHKTFAEMARVQYENERDALEKSFEYLSNFALCNQLYKIEQQGHNESLICSGVKETGKLVAIAMAKEALGFHFDKEGDAQNADKGNCEEKDENKGRLQRAGEILFKSHAAQIYNQSAEGKGRDLVALPSLWSEVDGKIGGIAGFCQQ